MFWAASTKGSLFHEQVFANLARFDCSQVDSLYKTRLAKNGGRMYDIGMEI